MPISPRSEKRIVSEVRHRLDRIRTFAIVLVLLLSAVLPGYAQADSTTDAAMSATPTSGETSTARHGRTRSSVSSSSDASNQTSAPGAISQPITGESNAMTSGQPGQPGQSTATTTGNTASKGYGAQATAPGVKLPTDAIRACLFFLPMNISVHPGEAFTVDLVLSNNSGNRPDGFDVSIAFDSQRLKFEGYDPSLLSPFLSDPASNLYLRHEPGRVDFSTDFDATVSEKRMTLLRLLFTARQALGRASLRFSFSPEGSTAVYSKGTDLLWQQDKNLRGVVNALVWVEPVPELDDVDALSTLPSPTSLIDASDGGEIDLTAFPPPNQGENPVWLSLQPPLSTVLTQGEDFWVDLVLNNPGEAPIESIGAVVGFDSRVLQAIDEDQDNWISEGVNIWDGAFHEDYPFDVLASNTVDNTRGRIYYRMACHSGQRALPTGVFARIHFRSIASTSLTPISLLPTSEGPVNRSFVRAYGTQEMNRSWNRPDSPSRLNLRIDPASSASTATQTKTDDLDSLDY